MGGRAPVAHRDGPQRRAADRAWRLAAGVVLAGALWVALAHVLLTNVLRATGSPATLASVTIGIVPVLAVAGLVFAVERRARTAAADAFAALRESEQRFREMLANIDLLAVALDRDGRVTFANSTLLRLLDVPAEDLIGEDWATRFVAGTEGGAEHRPLAEAPGTGELPAHHANEVRTRSGERRAVVWSNVVLRDASGTVVGSASVGEDVTARQRLEVERAQLSAAVEQAAESIIITDPRGSILYVNPAFERVSGYRRTEVLGANPRILKSGVQPSALYRAMWRQLASGEPWSGEVVNRRRDGSPLHEEVTISPVRDDDGAIAAYVAVQRDVTRERVIEAGLERATRERSQVAGALSRLHAAGIPEQTAQAICTEVVALPDVDFAAIITFAAQRVAVPLAVEAPPGSPLEVGRPLPPIRARHLLERASEGPWAERAGAHDGEHLERGIADGGAAMVAYAPLRHGPELLGVLAIGSSDSAETEPSARHLPAALEFAAIASALLAPSLHGRRREADVRADTERIIAERAFGVVFQPVFDLKTSMVIGWEALTRFQNGVRPDQQFAQAHAVGLGLDLEEACLDAALQASDALPGGGWVSLNVSPSLITERSRLGRLLGLTSRSTVLEVTEHAAVLDYADIRNALDSLGAGVRLAVDDAGAGYASLYHVVELNPHFVKLDRSLVADVDRDQARQALVAGMRHFARNSGCELIAEGVEREAEREVLRSLDVSFAQGYLLGRPAPATGWGGLPATVVQVVPRPPEVAQPHDRRGRPARPRRPTAEPVTGPEHGPRATSARRPRD